MIPPHDDLIFIAEAGVNHNGSIDLALQMVEVAAASGADYIKFQTFEAVDLVSNIAPLAEYQKSKLPNAMNQFQMLESLELSKDDFIRIKNYADELGIAFLSTPFSIANLKFLTDVALVNCLKISSGDLTFSLLLVEAGKSGKPIILSTGMATLDEILKAIKFLQFGRAILLKELNESVIPTDRFLETFKPSAEVELWVNENLTVLHCTSQYPAPNQSLNLLAIPLLKEVLGCKVGYSDHSINSDVPIIAATLGAKVIEKHFTLSRDLPGPDHKASMEPDEMTKLIERLRELPVILGKREKFCTIEEVGNVSVVRRSLHAKKMIDKGSIISSDDLVSLRPGDGIPASEFFNLLGSISTRSVQAGENFQI
jgi:N-acetylneuraminate synthase